MAYFPHSYINASHMSFGGTCYDIPSSRSDTFFIEGPPDAAIDPRLADFSQWHSSPVIERYLDGPQSVPISTLHPVQPAPVARSLAGTAPVPAPSHGRQCSPVSQHASSASSARSPPSETDRFYDTLGPPTPQDMAMSPPPMMKYYESWDCPGGQLFFPSMANTGCVNMRDVNPSQETLEVDHEQESIDFTHNLGYDTMSPPPAYDTSARHLQQHSEPFQNQRQSTPDGFGVRDTIIKEEIPFAAEQSRSHAYPPPTSEFEEEGPGADEPETLIKTEKDDRKDGEWKPGQHTRKNSAGYRLKGKGKQKRPAVEPKESERLGSSKRPRLEQLAPNSPPREKPVVVPAGRKSSFPCPDCKSATFTDKSGLEKHAKQQHTRPFPCVFQYAGCTSTFASKNEWKRHTVTQHLVLHYWLCTQSSCANVTNTPTAKKGSGAALANITSGASREPSLPNGAIFNRKDLYTQHVRRMHMPPNTKKAIRQKKPTPDWDERLKSLQKEAIRERCSLPEFMACPASGCTSQFRGKSAWDERMEHVARHLDRASHGDEPDVVFGGDDDATLTQWASSAEVNVVQQDAQGRWMLVNPLRSPASHLNGRAASASNGQTCSQKSGDASEDDCEIDAEGEDDDE